jgi:hypothetical protein
VKPNHITSVVTMAMVRGGYQTELEEEGEKENVGVVLTPLGYHPSAQAAQLWALAGCAPEAHFPRARGGRRWRPRSAPRA